MHEELGLTHHFYPLFLYTQQVCRSKIGGTNPIFLVLHPILLLPILAFSRFLDKTEGFAETNFIIEMSHHFAPYLPTNKYP